MSLQENIRIITGKCMITDKIMKKIVFAAFALLMFLNTAWAGPQTERRGSSGSNAKSAEGLGITFGYLNSSYRTTDWATDEIEKMPALNGFSVSLTKDFALIKSALYLQTGLGYIYQTRSRDLHPDVLPAKVVSDRKEHFLALPFRLKYTLPVSGKITVTADTGPVLLAGLSSRMNYRTRIQDDVTNTLSYNVYSGKFKSPDEAGVFESWTKENGGLPYGRVRRFDVLLGAGIGADFFRILEVRAGYDWGLVNRYSGELAADKKMYRGQFTLSVGLRF